MDFIFDGYVGKMKDLLLERSEVYVITIANLKQKTAYKYQLPSMDGGTK